MNWFRKQPGTGALEDPRTEEDKAKDYLFEEIVSSAEVVNWKEKDFSTIRKFSVRNQKNSSTCVAQTIAKVVEVLLWLKEKTIVPFSATPIYQKRKNKPGAGMFGVDAFNIARNGITLEELVPSQLMSEAQINAYPVENYEEEVGKVFKIANYVVLPTGDLETAASTIQKTGKAVALGFIFTSDEWSREVPAIISTNPTLRHFVAGVDFGIYKDKKGIFIEDSAHFGGKNRRFITEEFFNIRNTASMYPLNFKFQEATTDKPQYHFTKTLNFGETNADIVALQGILRYEGLFPSNVALTGYFGAVTAKAVLAFQKKHKVASDAELDSLQGRIVGPKTLQKLNELYG